MIKYLAVLLSVAATPLLASELEVHQSPTCGCCGAWVATLADSNLTAQVNKTAAIVDIKTSLKVPNEVWSCHTATADGYFFEGHVPGADIARFLADTPEGAIGLAVPGMPQNSPGMATTDAIYGFDVVMVMSDGSIQPFNQY